MFDSFEQGRVESSRGTNEERLRQHCEHQETKQLKIRTEKNDKHSMKTRERESKRYII